MFFPQTQSATTPDPATVLQAILLGLAITFVFSVAAAGFTAKQIDNISNPTYSKAFLATILKNMLGMTGFFVFGLFLDAPVWVTFAIAFSVIPILIYKIVFSTTVGEAVIVWLAAFAVEGIVGYSLFLFGILKFMPETTG